LSFACHFDLSSARRGATCCAVYEWLFQPSIEEDDLRVVFKVVDALCNPDAADSLKAEALAYLALEHLQGKAIPTLYGFYEVWGILRILALEPVGEAIGEDERINAMCSYSLYERTKIEQKPCNFEEKVSCHSSYFQK
jgi:hypothetical protein